MRRTARSAVVVAVAMLAAVALLAGTVAATSKMNTEFKTMYSPKDGTALAAARCLACHAPKPGATTLDTKKFNPYGADMKAKGAAADPMKALKAIEPLDSDKDGVKNIDEIRKGTLPGDPKSK